MGSSPLLNCGQLRGASLCHFLHVRGLRKLLWYIMALAQVKVITMVPKYSMQAWTNYRQKMMGVPIEWVLLDFSGSALSSHSWFLIAGPSAIGVQSRAIRQSC